MTCPYKYTIIIPHHEIPRLLQRCVESIPQRDDIQIIVVDDNSKNNENYPELYPFLRRKNLEYYPTKEGKGAGYARNVGLSHARGKWLLFADADDLYTETMPAILDDVYDSPHDIIFFNIRAAYCEDLTKAWNFKMTQNLFAEYEKTGNMAPVKVFYSQPWGKIYSHKTIKEHNIRFNEIKVCNDWWFCVQAAFYAHSPAIDHRELYIYTRRRDSLCYKTNKDKEEILLRLHETLKVQLFVNHFGVRFKPMMIRNQMMLLLRKYPIDALRELCRMHAKGVNIYDVYELVLQMFSLKYSQRWCSLKRKAKKIFHPELR